MRKVSYPHNEQEHTKDMLKEVQNVPNDNRPGQPEVLHGLDSRALGVYCTAGRPLSDTCPQMLQIETEEPARRLRKTCLLY